MLDLLRLDVNLCNSCSSSVWAGNELTAAITSLASTSANDVDVEAGTQSLNKGLGKAGVLRERVSQAFSCTNAAISGFTGNEAGKGRGYFMKLYLKSQQMCGLSQVLLLNLPLLRCIGHNCADPSLKLAMKLNSTAIARIAGAIGMLGAAMGCSSTAQLPATSTPEAIVTPSPAANFASLSRATHGMDSCQHLQSVRLQLTNAVNTAAAEPDVFTRSSLLNTIRRVSFEVATCESSTPRQILIETANQNERFRDSLITLIIQPEGEALGITLNDLLTHNAPPGLQTRPSSPAPSSAVPNPPDETAQRTALRAASVKTTEF